MDTRLDMDNEDVVLNIRVLKDVGAKIISNDPENNCEIMSTEAIALALPGFDNVLPY
jgi:hypothetical protein